VKGEGNSQKRSVAQVTVFEEPIQRRYVRGSTAEVVNCTAAFTIGYRG